MLAALLCNQPEQKGAGYGDTPRRRLGERFTTEDEWLKAQEELTAFKAMPELGRKIMAAEAIKVVNASVSISQHVLDAKEALAEYQSASEALLHLDELNGLLTSYFMLKSRQREEDDATSLLMLGLL